MDNIRYTLTLVGTYYTLEQLEQISALPGQESARHGRAANARIGRNTPAANPAAAPDRLSALNDGPGSPDSPGPSGTPGPFDSTEATASGALNGQEVETDAPLAQIAFAGRSNVGKSSLINALAGRRQLAKVSATPGKTASVNFYQVSSNRPGFTGYYLVDLPGYGYAQRSKSEREKWARLIDSYLRNTGQLRALAVLLDCRLEPQNSDLELIDFARSIGLPLLPILTKADKCRQNERAKRQAQWRKLLNGQTPLLTASTSSASGRIGIEQLWEVMTGMVNGTAGGNPES